MCAASSPSPASVVRAVAPRELVISGTPYIVAYRLKGREIQVLRVLHGARQWPEKL
jgi:toxin ParE1/3/4